MQGSIAPIQQEPDSLTKENQMTIRKLILAAVAAAVLPAAFAQSTPGPILRGEAWYPEAVQVRQDLAAYSARTAVMPDFDFVGGEAGYVPHRHELMGQDELNTRAMGNIGQASPAAQAPQEVRQYLQAGG
jgi:hypothetical protein